MTGPDHVRAEYTSVRLHATAGYGTPHDDHEGHDCRYHPGVLLGDPHEGHRDDHTSLRVRGGVVEEPAAPMCHAYRPAGSALLRACRHGRARPAGELRGAFGVAEVRRDHHPTGQVPAAEVKGELTQRVQVIHRYGQEPVHQRRVQGQRQHPVHARADQQVGDEASADRDPRLAAAQLGASCLALDQSGHGLSPGEAGDISPAEHLQDVLAAWDQLTARYRADPGRTGVCGSSYGACLAALAVQHRKVARLLLRAPMIVADEDLARSVRLLSRDRDPASASVLLGGLNRFHSPALVVESDNDEVIPHETVEAYLNALPAAGHAVIANATHALSRPEWREVFIQQLLSFFADL